MLWFEPKQEPAVYNTAFISAQQERSVLPKIVLQTCRREQHSHAGPERVHIGFEQAEGHGWRGLPGSRRRQDAAVQ